jgi:hypothetical protein
MTDVADFLASSTGSRHTPFKFSAIGDTLKGVIAEPPVVIDMPKIDGGGTERKLVIAVTQDDGNTFALFVKRGFMAQAIHEATVEAGVAGLAVGGQLAVRYSEDRDTGKPSKAKIFAAQYKPANAVTSVPTDLL